jgi:hypothetical protein
MDSFENMSIQVSFNTVFHIVENKQTAISENGKANLDRSIQFLNNVIRSIDSLGKNSGSNTKDVFYFVPNLKEMINILENKSPEISEEKVQKSREHFFKVKSGLELLQQHPQEFYSSSDFRLLKTTIPKILDIYSEEPHIVERDFSLSERFV